MGKSSYCSILALAAVLMAPAAQARVCTGTGDLYGSYGWLAIRSTAAATAPTVNGSLTPLGALLAGSANSAVFDSVGRIFFDGTGGVYASSAPASSLLPVGTYTLNTDCTVTVALTDKFANAGEAGLTPIQATATFEGIIVQNGNEIHLLQTGTGSGATLTLLKARQFSGCTADLLQGPFGLSAEGSTTTTPAAVGDAIPVPVTTPFRVLSRLVADGAGKFTTDAPGVASPLTARQATGTYTVETDCTGSGTIIDKDGKSRKVNFVVVSGGSAANSPPAIIFTFTDSGTTGSGKALQ